MYTQEKIFHAKPKFYGIAYLILIPIYAGIYYSFPEILRGEQTRSIIECIYFSAVTITTLGYGDITPRADIGFAVTASEAVLGVALIGLFLNSLSRVRSETTRNEEIVKEQKLYREGQISKLNGHMTLINPLLKKYRLSVIQLTSPLSNRKTEYNPEFTINDMKDLHGPSLLMTRDHNEPVVNFYFSALTILNSEIVDLVKRVDLRLFPNLKSHCLAFYEAFHTFDFSDAIRAAQNMRVGDKKMQDFVKEMLENFEGEPAFKQSNMINAYIALYYQIKTQMTLVEQIQIEVKNILEEQKM